MIEENDEINYYERWNRSSSRLKDIINLDHGNVGLGYEDTVIIKEDEIELNTTFKEFSDVMYRFNESLKNLIDHWSNVISEIESLVSKEDKKDSVKDLLEQNRIIIDKSKKISNWIEELIENGLRYENRDIPFKELKDLAEMFSEGEPRDPIKIIVKI